MKPTPPWLPIALGWCAAAAAQDAPAVHPAIEQLFREHPIVDGNLLPAYRIDLPASAGRAARRTSAYAEDLSEVIARTGVDLAITGAGHTLSEQLRLLSRLRAKPGGAIVLDAGDLESTLKNHRLGLLFQIQKPYPIPPGGDVQAALGHWFDSGVRIVQLAYSRADNQRLEAAHSLYAGGYDQDEMPLTPLGRRLVEGLLDRHMIVDLSHVGRRSTLEAAALALARGRPVTANHANCEALCPHPRNKSDAEIEAIARTGGLIALTPIKRFVDLRAPSTERLIAHLDYLVRELRARDERDRPIAMIDHVAVATDSWVNGWDESSPFYVDARMQAQQRWKILATLLYTQRGYTLEELAKIFGANFLRVLRAALPAPTAERKRPRKKLTDRASPRAASGSVSDRDVQPRGAGEGAVRSALVVQDPLGVDAGADHGREAGDG